MWSSIAATCCMTPLTGRRGLHACGPGCSGCARSRCASAKASSCVWQYAARQAVARSWLLARVSQQEHPQGHRRGPHDGRCRHGGAGRQNFAPTSRSHARAADVGILLPRGPYQRRQQDLRSARSHGPLRHSPCRRTVWFHPRRCPCEVPAAPDLVVDTAGPTVAAVAEFLATQVAGAVALAAGAVRRTP